MKKLLAILLSVALAVFALAACNADNSTNLGSFGENSSSISSSDLSIDLSSDSSSDSFDDAEESDDEKNWTGWH